MRDHRKALMIFRRDLRLDDHTALNQALRRADAVITAFIADERQLAAHPYRSLPGLAFMLESLTELDAALRAHGGALTIWQGSAEAAIARLIERHAIDAVWINRDYTPFSRARDTAIAELCVRRGVAFYQCDDALLVAPEHALKADGAPYTIFTPFFRNAAQYPVPRPDPLAPGCLLSIDGDLTLGALQQHCHSAWRDCEARVRGGRRMASRALANLARLANYDATRDRLALPDGSSSLSAHLKFGTCSIREAYHTIKTTFGATHGLLRALYWRDFFTHIAWHFPHVFGHAFHRQYDALPWTDKPMHFTAWCQGLTGFPIVDAGMRQLNATGFMHNRARMITASFLVKDLHLDWRDGERYFAQHLVDYDPAVNNGNWQWAASTGCDAQPYFRIFNPWLQQKKFDPDGVYVKQWLPELRDVPARALYESNADRGPTYPRPLVDHTVEARVSKNLFQTYRENSV